MQKHRFRGSGAFLLTIYRRSMVRRECYRLTAWITGKCQHSFSVDHSNLEESELLQDTFWCNTNYLICYYYFFTYLRGVFLRRIIQRWKTLHWIIPSWFTWSDFIWYRLICHGFEEKSYCGASTFFENLGFRAFCAGERPLMRWSAAARRI